MSNKYPRLTNLLVTSLTAHSFDTKTGAELTLGDLMAIPDNQIAPKLLVEFRTLI